MNSNLKTSSLGKVLVAVAVALGFSAILYVDPFILAAYLIVLAIIVAELVWILVSKMMPSLFFSVKSDGSTSKRTLIGEPVDLDFLFSKRMGGDSLVSFTNDSEFISIDPSVIKGRVNNLKVKISFVSPFAGKYSYKFLKFTVNTPLRLFSSFAMLPISLDYSVSPRVVSTALESAIFLGRETIGEIPLESLGVGTELYNIRSFQVGDSLRRVNWKATARTGEVMINEQLKETSSSYFLVLEAIADSYFDKDRLATTFLQTANFLTIQQMRFGILVHDGKNVILSREIQDPDKVLREAMGAALEFVGVSSSDLSPKEAELIAIPSSKMQKTSRDLSESGMTLLASIESEGAKSARANLEKFSSAKEILQNTKLEEGSQGFPPVIIYVSGLFGDSLGRIVEINSQVKMMHNTKFVVLNPCAPWIVAEDEDSAYKEFIRSNEKVLEIRRAGVECLSGDPITISRSMFSSK
ncbi:MAG: DUF58 domain-containing protein [Nitrososphaerales archaeon]